MPGLNDHAPYDAIVDFRPHHRQMSSAFPS